MDYFMEEEAKKEPAMNYVFVDEEKSVIPVSEEKASSAGDPLAIVKDVMYAEIETEKMLALIKAWEESEDKSGEQGT
ncbi:remorin 1.4-like [Rosa rugosa]|uniref:remorin 1.4-like n=1 Tax=Rosa rugosa TaxID=74645 RepID=UPI002B415AEA|nr:remorin 1.4-like [Rosa rugosa]